MIHITTFLVAISALCAAQSSPQTGIKDWKKLTPSPDINWVPCFGRFQCTVLQVPLDYGNHSTGVTAIPFIKYPAKIQPAPDLLWNGGGPGEAWTDTEATPGFIETFQKKYGTTHNIVTFDIRATNADVSNIDLSCFTDAPAIAPLADVLLSGASQAPQSTTDAYYRGRAFTERCNVVQGTANASATLRYASTVANAQDMLSFIEANARAMKTDPKQAKLSYMGASYGTVLGQTFAALFPDRIERMVLDGTVDGEGYYKGVGPPEVTQVDKAIEGFFHFCHQAGPKRCLFYEKTTRAIAARLRRLLDHLDAHPLPVGDPAITQIPTLVNAWQLRQALFLYMYSPLSDYPAKGNSGFEDLAQMLVDLEHGNGTSLLLLSDSPSYLNVTANGQSTFDNTQASQLTLCIDNHHRRAPLKGLNDYVRYVRELERASTWSGTTQAALTSVLCIGMEVSPPASGQFLGSLPPSARKTSFPILFTNGNRDPATPSTGAQKMSEAFPGSVLVLLNAIGHTTLASAPSKCLNQITLAYIANGTMPPANTVCEPDELPFGLTP